ncbi:thiosulfate ABC transporter, periplasmic thiosulfate-binding protein [Vibrio cholerae]|nr:thiosulfate ABC transporter, periplasmic thiosulfate-binding protein [Vibrio cholerae]
MNRIKSTLTALLLAGSFQASAADQTILNSSYDIARELFVAYNPVFAEHWQ